MPELSFGLRNHKPSPLPPVATSSPTQSGPADQLPEVERLHIEGLLGAAVHVAENAQILANL